MFCINTLTAIFVILATSFANLLYRERTSLQYRMLALGLCLTATMGVYCLYYLEIVPFTVAFLGVYSGLCWLSGLLYLSFMVDMTAQRRSSYFYLSYLLPIPLAALTVFLPRPVGIVAIVAGGTAVLVYWTLAFMLAWIRSATDERARRDGEWMLLVFAAFGLGLIVCFFHVLTGVFWLLAIWMLVIFYTVNVLGIFRNLTNRENQIILDNVFDIVIILDEGGKIVRMNRRGYQITEYPSVRITGNGIETVVVHPDLSDSRRREWLEEYAWVDTGLKSRRSPSIDAFVSTRSGDEIPVDLRIVSLVNLSRSRTGYIVSATDMRITRQLMKEISDREYAARDLALSESKFSRMFIFNPTGIIILDLDTMRITDANPAIEEILGSESPLLIGKSLSEIGVEMEELPYGIFLEKIQMEGTVPEFPAIIRQEAPGSIRRCRLSAVSFDLNHMRRILLSVADVTQEEEMREALLRKQKVETIGILAGGIAHDFNNILAVILGHIGLAKMRIVDPHSRLPVEKAEQACIRAREMTGQLLAFSRGGQPIVGTCDTKQLITESSMLTVADSAVACLFEFPPGIWPLRVDRIQVGQVFSNLVHNSVEAMGNSGIIDIRAVNLDLRNMPPQKRPVGTDSKPIEARAYVEVRIHDQGPGVSDELRKKIFDPFFTTKKNGTGLGLSIVFSVVQNHGGAITVGTGTDGGAVFSLYLPADPDNAVEQQANPGAKLAGKRRVLVMDDDREVRDTAVDMLTLLGCDVTPASDGSAAVRLYRDSLSGKTPFDFCILDLVIPNGMSGTRCAQEILQLNPTATLIVSSGYSDDPVLSRWGEYGFKGAIPKPYTIEELKECLANMLVI